MSLLKIISDAVFRNEEKESARAEAKQRLHLVLINDRAGRDTPDFMPKLRQEIVDVLKKYIAGADDDDVEINVVNKDNTSIMEMSISLDKSKVNVRKPKA
jgi:cell division topological specificity factor